MQLVDRYGNITNDFLCVSGSGVFRANYGDAVTIHSVQEVKQLFFKKYGVMPKNNSGIIVTYMNGDGNANQYHVQGATFQDNYFFATLNTNVIGSNIRINYQYMYDVSNGIDTL